eukprot:Gb_20401 [translate_table: standard]
MENNASTSNQQAPELEKVAVPWKHHTSLPAEKEKVLNAVSGQEECLLNSGINSEDILQFIGELFKQKLIPEKIVYHYIQELLGSDAKSLALPEELQEALCLLFRTAAKELEESPKSRMIIDSYFARLREISNNPHLVRDLRENKWIPRQEEVNELYVEMERRLGLSSTNANIQNGRGKPARAIISVPRFTRRTRYGPFVRSDLKSGMKSEGLLRFHVTCFVFGMYRSY